MQSQTSEGDSSAQAQADWRTPGKPAVNKTTLTVLVVLVVALCAYLALRPEIDVGIDDPGIREEETPAYMRDIGGVEADYDLAEFDVQVEARMEGARSVLEFTVTEAKGWGAQEVHLTFQHMIQNEETGEWEPDPAFPPKEVVCMEVLDFGEPLVCTFPLTQYELGLVGGGMGGSEEWTAKVLRVERMLKPE